MMGLSSVIVGTPTEYPEEVARLLQLPKEVYPLVLVCMGYPDETPEKKYRWDTSAVLHYNTYKDVAENHIKKYAEKIEKFTGMTIEEFITKVSKAYPQEELTLAAERMNAFFR